MTGTCTSTRKLSQEKMFILLLAFPLAFYTRVSMDVTHGSETSLIGIIQ